MKKLSITLILLLLSFGMAMAQEKNGFYVELSTGFSNELSDSYVQLAPGIGYKFSDSWAIGFRTTFRLGDETSEVKMSAPYERKNTNAGKYSAVPEVRLYTPYVRYTFLHVNKFHIGAEAMLSWATVREIPYYGGPTYTPPFFEAGANVNVAYHLSRHFAFFAQGLFLGYSHSDFANKGAVIGKGRFVLDANWRRAMLGARVVF